MVITTLKLCKYLISFTPNKLSINLCIIFIDIFYSLNKVELY